MPLIFCVGSILLYQWLYFPFAFQFLSEQPDHSVIGNSTKSDEDDWCVGCGWDQYGDFEQQQAMKYYARENPTAVKLQQVRFVFDT